MRRDIEKRRRDERGRGSKRGQNERWIGRTEEAVGREMSSEKRESEWVGNVISMAMGNQTKKSRRLIHQLLNTQRGTLVEIRERKKNKKRKPKKNKLT